MQLDSSGTHTIATEQSFKSSTQVNPNVSTNQTQYRDQFSNSSAIPIVSQPTSILKSKFCPYCDEDYPGQISNHYLQQCFKFNAITPEDRPDFVLNNRTKICLFCLYSGHYIDECTRANQANRCNQCHVSHNQLLGCQHDNVFQPWWEEQ